MLGKNAQRVVKAIHVASAGVWLGGLATIAVLLAAGPDDPASRTRTGLDLGAHLVSAQVLFWAFVVTLATGLLFALATPWGTIRHHWITAKWLLAIVLFAITLAWQNPALAVVAGLSDAGLAAAGGLDAADARAAALAVAIAQVAIVLVVFAISTLKPWGQRRRDLPRKVVAGLAGAGIAIGGAFGVMNHVRLARIRALPIETVAPATRADGTWRGAVDDCGLAYEVEVTLASGRIARIVATRTGDTRYAQLGAAVLPRIVAAQTAEVDAITGATTTSRCLARAVGRALVGAPPRAAQ